MAIRSLKAHGLLRKIPKFQSNSAAEPSRQSSRTQAERIKQLEYELQECELRWKFAVEGSSDGLWDWNVIDNSVFFSKKWKEMLGFGEDEIGHSLDEWERLIHPDHKAAVVAVVQAYLEGKTPVYTSEYQIRCKDGRYKWILDRGMIVSRDAKGNPLRIVGTQSDISVRKQLEEAREEALMRLQKIAGRVPGVVYQYRLRPDGSSCFPYASDAIRDIFRVSPEQVRDDAGIVFTKFHPDDYDGILNSIRKSAKNLTPWLYEYRVRFDDGCERWLLGNALPQREVDGSTLWHGFITDITELKQAQQIIHNHNKILADKVQKQSRALASTHMSLINKVEQLRRSNNQLQDREARLNSIFNASVEGIITINANDVIVAANSAVETILGYTSSELLGYRISKLISASPREIYAGDSKQGNTGDEIHELEGRHKNGTLVPLDLTVSGYAVNNSRYFTSIVRDVSLRKRREAEDKAHLDELAHVTRLGLMGEMASGIAHEINQPLSAIATYSHVSLNLATQNTPDWEKLVEILRKTQQQALRAGQIVHRMREFVKSNSKRCSTVDINALINDAVDLCLSELKQNNVRLTFNLEAGLPILYVDPIQIEQVIINLLRNSVEALQSVSAIKQPHLTLQSCLTPDNAVKVAIKDNGPGLDDEQQQRILTPFYTTKSNGMGMGLSISRSLIEAHEGSLQFNSKPGKGTTFYFTLPVRGA